ncbi:hypothetical protein AAJP47_09880 [Psychrobacter sp. B38]|uniref:hypothetical protein n=1 Tax=Psychrobacter sp. B38 TaxID=3143538 RepID=UPI0032115E59
MKTNHQAIKHCLSSPIKSNTLFASVFLTGALLLTGCQSTSLSSNSGQSSAMTAKQTSAAAKTALATALQKQRRQSFSYHSNVEINNDQQSADIETKALAGSDYMDQYCEDTHDQAYADLITQAETQNKDILSAGYDIQRTALKDRYLECSQAYEAWVDQQSDSDITVPPSYQQLFDNYDDTPKQLDSKKAKLLDAYLLKPLSINAQGIYQPMAGRATILASAQYQARNHQTSINQPIYIDFKNGDIYLWADNFAIFNVSMLDDSLGTKWQNKWLKIAIDDGTLPKGFGAEVIKSHFAAMDQTFAQAPVSQFDYVAPNILASLSPKLPTHQLTPMLASDQIIRRVQSAESYEQFYQDYMRIFYDRISQQYPELVSENQPDETTDIASDNFTSKAWVQQILAMIKSQIDNNDESDADKMSPNAEVQALYGFNKRGQLQWQHLRDELPSKINAVSGTSNKGMVVDVLQQYSAISNKDMAFPNLPSNVQVPNASNSIDARKYGKELMQYYREGNGTFMGKMVFSRFPMSIEGSGAVD